MLFTTFEFNWQKTNRAFAPPPLWHTFGHTLYMHANLSKQQSSSVYMSITKQCHRSPDKMIITIENTRVWVSFTPPAKIHLYTGCFFYVQNVFAAGTLPGLHWCLTASASRNSLAGARRLGAYPTLAVNFGFYCQSIRPKEPTCPERAFHPSPNELNGAKYHNLTADYSSWKRDMYTTVHQITCYKIINYLPTRYTKDRHTSASYLKYKRKKMNSCAKQYGSEYK